MFVITADDTYVTSGSSVVLYEGNVIHAGGSNDKAFLALVAGLTLELNKSGSLNLTLPPTNNAIQNNYLRKLKTVIRIYRNKILPENLIWKGRILDSSRDFIGRITYKCEGWLSVLCDSVVRKGESYGAGITVGEEEIIAAPDAFFTALIDKHNAQVEAGKRLTPHTYGFDSGGGGGTSHSEVRWGSTGSEVRTLQEYLNKLNYTISVDGIFGYETDSAVKSFQTASGLTADGVVDSDTWDALESAVSGSSHYTVPSASFPIGAYENTLDYIQTNFLQNGEIGGRIWVTESDIYYYADGFENYGGQDITFGQNLLDLTEYIDASEIYTVLIPVGKDGLTLTDTYGVDYVENQTAIDLFGRIVRQQEYSDIDSASTLRSMALQTLSENVTENTTIEISAFDLSLLNVDADGFNVGDYVRVMSPPHNLDHYYLCTGITLDLCDPAKSSYTLGVNPDTLTAKQAKLTKTVDTAARYVSEDVQEAITATVVDGNVSITTISFYKYRNTVHLSFTIKYLKVVTAADPAILSFDSSYAPASIQVGTVYDETTDTAYGLRVTTDGKIQTMFTSAIDDVASGSISWQN